MEQRNKKIAYVQRTGLSRSTAYSSPNGFSNPLASVGDLRSSSWKSSVTILLPPRTLTGSSASLCAPVELRFTDRPLRRRRYQNQRPAQIAARSTAQTTTATMAVFVFESLPVDWDESTVVHTVTFRITTTLCFRAPFPNDKTSTS